MTNNICTIIMSKPLTEYFQVIGTPPSMQMMTKRKSSIKKPSIPQKSTKLSPDYQVSNIIDLTTSDEEDMCKLDLVKNRNNSSKEDVLDEVSSSSNSTIIYTPGTPRKSETPLKNSDSSALRVKYFSPVKRKSLKMRTPSKVKKNLCDILDENKKEENVFSDACNGMDDKTVFLLTIINKYLSNHELQPLLLQQSQDLLLKCMKTKKPGMRLVCRLYWRKAGWYRLCQVRKITTEKGQCVDDSSIKDMINNLSENGIIECANCEVAGSSCTLELEDFLALLKSDELKTICKDLKLKTSNKIDAIECLKSYSCQKNISSYFIGYKSNNASRVLKILSEKTGPCFRLSGLSYQTLNELYLLMYLGIDYNLIREKKLELTLINDKIKRECYPDIDVFIEDASVVFKKRDEFERYIQAHNVYEDFMNTTDVSKKCDIIESVYKSYEDIDKMMLSRYRAISPWLQRFTPPYLYIKLLEAGVQELKKMKAERYIALAVDILTQMISQTTFRQHKKAEWYAEKALILDKFKCNVEEAAKVLLEGFNSEVSEVAKDLLRPRAIKIATRKANAVSEALSNELLRYATKEQIMEKNFDAKHIYKMPMDLNKNTGKIKFETRTASGRHVQDAEDYCKSCYIAEGRYTHGGHWEGKIVTTIFFLLFWDIIYAKLSGVRGLYLTRFQMFPLDMFLESFYVNRKALIEERLKEIEESPIDDTVERMYTTWNTRPETEMSSIVRSIEWENIASVCRCLEPRPLAAVCRRLATDYGYSHSGFPDLTLWNEHTNEVKFVEVKTDSDKPSMKQMQWMHYLQENGIETEFCYVGVNTMRCRARNNDLC